MSMEPLPAAPDARMRVRLVAAARRQGLPPDVVDAIAEHLAADPERCVWLASGTPESDRELEARCRDAWETTGLGDVFPEMRGPLLQLISRGLTFQEARKFINAAGRSPLGVLARLTYTKRTSP